MNGDFFENCNDIKVVICNCMNNNNYMYESNFVFKSSIISFEGFLKLFVNYFFYFFRNL